MHSGTYMNQKKANEQSIDTFFHNYLTKCVHTEHCCVVHGCQYGDEDCPVYCMKKLQSFPCEDCDVVEPDPEWQQDCEKRLYIVRKSYESKQTMTIDEILESWDNEQEGKQTMTKQSVKEKVGKKTATYTITGDFDVGNTYDVKDYLEALQNAVDRLRESGTAVCKVQMPATEFEVN